MTLKRYLVAVVAVTMAVTAFQPVTAQPYGYGGGPNDRNRGTYDDGYRAGYDAAYRAAYRKGYDDGRARRRYNDRYTYAGPPRLSDDRSSRWNQRYSRTYSYNDDVYYRECRNQPDPGGVIAGALIGGLLGNTIGRGSGQAAATVAGVVIGGAVGASMTRNMNCEDRSYAYKTYYNGFNSGRPNSDYRWRNPQNGHYGDFQVGDYYNDPDGFRCATYSQVIYINNRPEETRGRACQQPDGTWTIVS